MSWEFLHWIGPTTWWMLGSVGSNNWICLLFRWLWPTPSLHQRFHISLSLSLSHLVPFTDFGLCRISRLPWSLHHWLTFSNHCTVLCTSKYNQNTMYTRSYLVMLYKSLYICTPIPLPSLFVYACHCPMFCFDRFVTPIPKPLPININTALQHVYMYYLLYSYGFVW